MKKLVLLAVSLLLLGVQVAWAQRTVTGKVTSSDEPMGHPQVAVKVPGTSIGTVTNFDGEFSLSVPEGVSKLEFSCLGLTTKIVDISNNMNVKMEASAIALTEVSITGYGVSRKAATTGAAAQVEGDVVKKSTESNVINGLQGNVAGLQISSSTGQPGAPTSARIRGTSSVNSGNAPLYVIDGVPVSNGGYGMYTYTDPLASLNPEDIENIAVLKDASATSIYGSRASNGVIVITTKKGNEGKTQFSLNAKVGMSTKPFVKHSFQKVNADDYRSYLADAKRNTTPALAGLADSNFLKQFINDFPYDLTTTTTNTDWWDEVTRIGIIQDYSLAASGGNEKYNFFASVGYFSNQGFVIGTDFTRYSARLNLDYKATNWLTFGMNLSGAYAEVNTVPTSLAYASPIWSAMCMRPTDPVKNEDGSWFTEFNEHYNPVAIYTDENHNVAFQQQYKALFSPYLRFQFYKNVFFQTKVGVDFVTVKEKNVWSPTVDPQGKQMNGLVQRTDETSAVLTITNTLNWMPTIAEKHNLNFLIGQEAQRFNDYTDYMSGFDYAIHTLEFLDIANAVETAGSSYTLDAALASYFANVEYDYDGKYYLSASVRGDGSSRFGDSKKWGAFWSVGGKYRISAENFMASTQAWLNNLTLRVSYGTTGNQNVGYYAAQGLYSLGRYGGLTALTPGSLGNPNLTWESRNKFDIGLEFSVFDRLTVEVDYYNDITDDMIFGIPLSAACGFTSLTTNIGKMRNQGVELQINALLMNRRNFQWTLALNLTSNDNKVLKLATQDPIVGSISILEEGRSTNEYYMREWAGVDPATGKPRWWGDEDHTFYVFNYNQAPQIHLGSSNPKIYGGISTRFDFYNVDISLQFNYSYGNKLFVNDLRYVEGVGERKTSPTTYYVFDNRWKNPGDETDVPQVVYGGNNGADGWSSRQLVDASYFRIKTFMIGYTLPKKFAQKAYLSSFRAYVSIDNLYTVTSKNFRGYDPEAGLGMTQAANYPLPINYTLGINVGF